MSTPPTWAVQIVGNSYCARDARFAAELAAPIPPNQRRAPAEAELVADVSVSRVKGGLWARVQVFDRVLQSQAGSRELELPMGGCRATAESIALVIGVLVETGRVSPPVAEPSPEPPPSPPELPPPPPEPEVAAPEPEESPPVAPERKRYAWLGPRAGHDLTLQAAGGFGLLPNLYWGGTLGWGIRAPRMWPIWLSATGFFPSTTSNGRGEFAALYGGIAVCPVHAVGQRLRGQVCPSFAAGVIWADASGLRRRLSGDQVIALLGIEFKGDYRIAGPLAMSAGARAEVPLVRPNFAYENTHGENVELHHVAPLTLTMTASFSLLFR